MPTVRRARLDAEGAHWAEWLRRHGYIGERPKPGRRLILASAAIELAGMTLTLIGPAGYLAGAVGYVSTLGGVVGMYFGGLVSARAKEAVIPENEAISLVLYRLQDLDYARNGPGPGT